MTEQERRYEATRAFAIRIAEATIAAKKVPAWKKAQAAARLAELRGERTCRGCTHGLSAHIDDYDCACGCEAFIPQRADMTPVADVIFEAVFEAPPTARRVN